MTQITIERHHSAEQRNAETSKPAKKSWRDVLKIHPAAKLFPLLSGTELRELADDIGKNGLRSPIMMTSPHSEDEQMLLDGRNRLDALELLGVEIVAQCSPNYQNGGGMHARYSDRGNGEDGYALNIPSRFVPANRQKGSYKFVDHLPNKSDPYAAVISANIFRRHLTAEQKSDLVAKLLKLMPEKSNRVIAEQAKVDDKTVGKIRGKLESTAEIPQLKTRVGKDNKSRPASKREKTGEAVSAADIMEERSRRVEHWSPGCDSEPHDAEKVAEPGDSQQAIDDTRVLIARLGEITRHSREAFDNLRSLDPELLPELSDKLVEATESFRVLFESIEPLIFETLEPPIFETLEPPPTNRRLAPITADAELPDLTRNLLIPNLKARYAAFDRGSRDMQLRDKVQSALEDLSNTARVLASNIAMSSHNLREELRNRNHEDEQDQGAHAPEPPGEAAPVDDLDIPPFLRRTAEREV
jgi:hypothetical protein